MEYCIYCMKIISESYDVCPHCGKIQSKYKPISHALRPGTILNKRYMVGTVIARAGSG